MSEKSKNKPKRHIDFEHVIVIILIALVVVFGCTVLMAVNTVEHPAHENTSSSTSSADTTPSATATVQSQLSDNDIKNRIASVINNDLKQKYGLNYTYVSSDELSLQKSGDDEYVVTGKFSAATDGKSQEHQFEYTIDYDTIDGTTQQFAIKSLKMDGKDEKASKATAAPVSKELQEQGRYEITVGTALHVNAHASSGEVRVDAIDSSGNTSTIYDKQGPFNESDIEIKIAPGKYTIVMYSSASDWNWSFTAS